MGCIYRDANDNDVKDRNINDHENFSDNKKPQGCAIIPL